MLYCIILPSQLTPIALCHPDPKVWAVMLKRDTPLPLPYIATAASPLAS